jgi:hypothetical protein
MNTITDFSMRDVWNMASLRPDRPLVERDYLWASQLNQPTVDNFLSMKGEKPTNPPNARSRRKFLAGNILYLKFESKSIMEKTAIRKPRKAKLWKSSNEY